MYKNNDIIYLFVYFSYNIDTGYVGSISINDDILWGKINLISEIHPLTVKDSQILYDKLKELNYEFDKSTRDIKYIDNSNSELTEFERAAVCCALVLQEYLEEERK